MNAFLAEGMALTGDLDNALRLIDDVIAQIERPGWEERLHYAEILRLKGWTLTLKGMIPTAPSGTFSSRSPGLAANKRNPGNCVRRLASHGCGRAKANAKTPMSCSPRFTAGSLKVSMLRT